MTRRLLRVFYKAPITQLLWCHGLLRVDGPQMLPKIIAAKTIGAFRGLKCFSVSSCLVICTPGQNRWSKADAIFWDYNAQEALLLPTSTRAASRIYFTFQQAILAIKTITLVNKEVLITPSFQFFWYVCWSSLPALPTKPI